MYQKAESIRRRHRCEGCGVSGLLKVWDCGCRVWDSLVTHASKASSTNCVEGYFEAFSASCGQKWSDPTKHNQRVFDLLGHEARATRIIENLLEHHAAEFNIGKKTLEVMRSQVLRLLQNRAMPLPQTTVVVDQHWALAKSDLGKLSYIAKTHHEDFQLDAMAQALLLVELADLYALSRFARRDL